MYGANPLSIAATLTAQASQTQRLCHSPSTATLLTTLSAVAGLAETCTWASPSLPDAAMVPATRHGAQPHTCHPCWRPLAWPRPASGRAQACQMQQLYANHQTPCTATHLPPPGQQPPAWLRPASVQAHIRQTQQSCQPLTTVHSHTPVRSRRLGRRLRLLRLRLGQHEGAGKGLQPVKQGEADPAGDRSEADMDEPSRLASGAAGPASTVLPVLLQPGTAAGQLDAGGGHCGTAPTCHTQHRPHLRTHDRQILGSGSSGMMRG